MKIKHILWSILLLLLIPMTVVRSQSIKAPEPDRDMLFDVINNSFSEPPLIGDMRIEGNYAVGLLMLQIGGEYQESEGKFYVAKWNGSSWSLAVGGDEDFVEQIYKVPNKLLSKEEKDKIVEGLTLPVDLTLSEFDQDAELLATGYKLPWRCGTTQYVRHDWDSHNAAGMGVAIDIDMNLNTYVTAAAAGVVHYIKQDSNKCGCSSSLANDGNYVVILNDMGYYDYYVHIKQNGALVSVGQRVYQGQDIALSYKTGYTCGSRAVCDPGTCPVSNCNVYANLQFHVQNAAGARLRPAFDDVGVITIGYKTSGNCPPPVPAIPSGLTASDGTYTDRIQVNWNVVEHATTYQVYRATSAGGTRTHIANPGGTSYTDMDVTPGVTYWYWVKACNSTGCSNYSGGDSGYARIPIPTAPTNVQATDGTYTDRVDITWSSVTWATSYQVYRAESASGTRSQIATPTSNNYSDTTAFPGTTYWYWIKACNTSGCSDFSVYDTGYARIPIPAIPTNINASDGTSTEAVHVSWSGVEWAINYQIFRSDSIAGSKTQIGGSETLTFSDSTITPGVIYWYFVKACSVNGCSDFSVGDSGYAKIPIPSIPTYVSASDGEFIEKVHISWAGVTWAVDYQVFRASSSDGTKTQIATTSTPSFDDLTAVHGITYWYFVKACNTSGCSDFSLGDSGYAAFPIPEEPTDIAASDGTYPDKVLVTWSTVEWASNYQVFKAGTEDGIKTQIGTTETASYTDLEVVPEITYWYFVKACSTTGCSEYSTGDSGFALIPAPDIPTEVDASDGTYTDRVQITWSTVEWALNYQVFRANSSTGTKTQIGTSDSLSYSDLDIIHEVVYWYFIKACNDTGCSNYSVGDSGYAALPLPAIPEGVNASDGTYPDRVVVTWNEVNDANSYQIFRANSSTSTKTQIGTSATLSFDDTTIMLGQTYWYFVKACNSYGCSDYSLGDSGYAPVPIPGIPLGVNASDGTFEDWVRIDWEAVNDATSYQIYKAYQENGSRTLIANSTDLEFDDINVIVDVSYWYWVKACNSSGCSDYSLGDSGYAAMPILDPPTNVQATDGNHLDKVVITWDEVINAEEYLVFRAISPDATKTEIGSTASITFSDTSIIPGTTYWYYVKTCNSAGCSEFSEGDSGFAKMPVPNKPIGVKASDGSFSDYVKVTWSETDFAENYEVYRAISPSSVREYVNRVDEPEFNDYGVTVMTTYWYWVKACNSTGCSAFSDYDSGYAAGDYINYRIWFPLIQIK
ncbi:MAG TPA: peptidoglycan DD-metalloendopeptidase family protein [Anaerolineaceae bacterium]|nr:peptidoglycan DD-metalloendopeptidase family protein [Anaerolineaceae bacterium]